jgi:hypothetical protein
LLSKAAKAAIAAIAKILQEKLDPFFGFAIKLKPLIAVRPEVS